jgi:hypothetical protein
MVEESIINNHSIIENFSVFTLLVKKQNYSVLAAIEKNIGMLVSLKVFSGIDLTKINREQNGHLSILSNHPNILQFYRGAVDHNHDYIMIR